AARSDPSGSCGASCRAGAVPRTRGAMSLPKDQFLQGVFDGINGGLIVLDSERRMLRWNQWLTIATGVPRERGTARRLEDVFAGQIRTRLLDAVTDAVASGVSSVLTHSL